MKPLIRRLREPPIVEIVCGFFFAPLAGLDPIWVGKYWSARKAREYPKHYLRPPVADRVAFTIGDDVGPLRCWLVDGTDEYILQVQPDRFYFNWRKREGDYPHFNDHDGRPGVLSRSLAEFNDFADFAAETLGQRPQVSRLELAKIDALVNPKNWRDYSDLCSILPILRALPKITDDPAVQLSMRGERDGFDVMFQLTTASVAPDLSVAVQLETRLTARSDGTDLRPTFTRMNTLANEVFFESLATTEDHRFGGQIE